jgi:tRNA pseudouridine55 synthase
MSDSSLSGILNVDKPPDVTSHDVVNRVRRLSGIRRVGHAGTLDPLATGVLLVCLGRATRLVEYLVGRPKQYLATIRLGQETNTYDADGEVVAERPVNVTRSQVAAALAHFYGAIDQVPPMFSAVKQAGQPLYKLARQGIDIPRAARQVTVYEIELLAWQPPDVEIHVTCSAGTYIRSIAHDLGRMLGCGGHIAALRRTAVGGFALNTAVPLDELDSEGLLLALQPADAAVSHLPRLDLTAAEAAAAQQGQRVPRRSSESDEGLVRAYKPDGRFLGLLRPEGTSWQPHKIFEGQTTES